MSHKNRPLSPHLQIYKPQITSILSILHRLTGVTLALGLPVLVWFLSELAFGDLESSLFTTVFAGIAGKLFLMGWTFSMAYHLCNGIRHLVWDIGWGYELSQVRTSGWLVVIMSFVLTGVVWAYVIAQGGL